MFWLRTMALAPLVLSSLAVTAARPALAEPARAADPAATAPGAAAVPLVQLRLFVDLECPYTRAAWPRYQAVLAARGGKLHLHHLPLARHPLALPAALAALAARAQDRELAFVDAVLRGPAPDEAALLTAAQTAGLDVPRWERDRATAATATALDAERQRVAALGIRATPAALLGGRGWSGVPPQALLEAMWRRAERDAAAAVREAGPDADAERMVLSRTTPGFQEALDQLRGTPAASAATGRAGGAPAGLGSRWQVRVPAPVPVAAAPKAAAALVQAVVWFDPASDGDLKRVVAWQTLAGKQPGLQVVALPAPQGDAASRDGALWYAASVVHSAERALTALSQIDPKLPGAERWPQALKAAGIEAAPLAALRDKPQPAEWLARVAQLAAQVDAQPGAVYLAGHRWWGRLDEVGPALSWLNQQAAARRKQGVAQRDLAEAAVAGGKLRDPAEADLEAPLPAGDAAAWPVLVQGGPEVSLVLDPDSMHARAAWYVLRRTVAGKPIPTTLRVAVVPRKGGCRSQLGDAVLAAAPLGAASAILDAAFDASKPLTDKQINAAVAKAGVDAAKWQAARANQQPIAAAAAAVCQLRDLHPAAELPLIVVGDRRYLGRIDETALVRAIRVSLASER